MFLIDLINNLYKIGHRAAAIVRVLFIPQKRERKGVLEIVGLYEYSKVPLAFKSVPNALTTRN